MGNSATDWTWKSLTSPPEPVAELYCIRRMALLLSMTKSGRYALGGAEIPLGTFLAEILSGLLAHRHLI